MISQVPFAIRSGTVIKKNGDNVILVSGCHLYRFPLRKLSICYVYFSIPGY